MAYAAVTSLVYTISRFLKSDDNDIQIVQNSSPQMIKVLAEEADSLAKVLRGLDSNSRRFSSKMLSALDAKIRDAVFKLEDVVESHLLHQFLTQSENIHQHQLVYSLDIEELKQDMDYLIQMLNRLKAEYIYELSSNNLPEEEEQEEDGDDDVIVKSESTMFGSSNQILIQIKDTMLTTRYDFHIFALFGMAGIGKTTLARKLFEDSSISSFYESQAFVTIGPEYHLEDVYLYILKQLCPEIIDDEEIMMLLQGDHQQKLRVSELMLQEFLTVRKCLIVLDGVWDNQMLKYFFDLYRRGTICNLLITTRLVIEAQRMFLWKIPFLDKKESWNLLCTKVFGGELSSCTPQLERAGKKIAENCEGLPLTIVTVANILSEQERTPEHWNKVAANKQHSVYVEAYAQMHKVLVPSYYCLPQYLRISFLYMGFFPQNYEIPCTKLLMLWRAEGFIRLEQEKNSVMNAHFKKLLMNSVLIAHSTPTNDKFKTVGLHSSFWYVCKKEASKSKFFHSFTTLDDCLAQGIETQRRLCIYNPVLFAIKDAFDRMASVSAARSLLCTSMYHQYPVPLCFGTKLLRVLYALPIRFYKFPIEVLKLIHLTYFTLTCDGGLPPPISKLWNLEYLIVDRHLSIKSIGGAPSYLPVEIWDMKKLVHLQVLGSDLPEPPQGSRMMLLKLSKLLDVSPYSCTQRIIERLPNLTKLGIRIELSPDDVVHQPLGCFDHIQDISYLRSFKCVVMNPRIRFEVAAPPPVPLPIFPYYLRKLTLSGLGYPWEEMSMISSMPKLEVLKLLSYAFQGPKWDVQDKEFMSLKVLVIEETDLVQWSIKDDYRIEDLKFVSLKHCYKLKEMPMGFTSSLQKIEVVDCNPLVLQSVSKLKEDWERRYTWRGSGLDLNVHSSWDKHN